MFRRFSTAFYATHSHVRNAIMEKNLYRIQYSLPLLDDKIGPLESFEIKDNEIIITFINPEIKEWVDEKEIKTLPKFHYLS